MNAEDAEDVEAAAELRERSPVAQILPVPAAGKENAAQNGANFGGMQQRVKQRRQKKQGGPMAAALQCTAEATADELSQLRV